MDHPAYLQLSRSGALAKRARVLIERLSCCDLCPRSCHIDRRHQLGICGVGVGPVVAAAVVHRGEEPAISGTRGSGGVFFSGCNLTCLFCQNYQISQVRPPIGQELTPSELGQELIRLQDSGCHNINFVSGGHVVGQILQAVDWAVRRGLHLPIVWNSNAFERVEVLRMFEGVVDIYLPDIKYGGDGLARRWSGVSGYVGVARAALVEMARQVGPLQLDEDGLARRGLIVRHLVLPHNAAGTAACLRFVSRHLPKGVAISLMGQYAPAYRAHGHALLGRTLNEQEYTRALHRLEQFDLDVGWTQSPVQSPDHYRPDFRAPHPFEWE